MVVIIGFEGSANKIGIGIVDDGKVRELLCVIISGS
jgi:tRNA A37 threonylcarbamoyltransferase TsaD